MCVCVCVRVVCVCVCVCVRARASVSARAGAGECGRRARPCRSAPQPAHMPVRVRVRRAFVCLCPTRSAPIATRAAEPAPKARCGQTQCIAARETAGHGMVAPSPHGPSRSCRDCPWGSFHGCACLRSTQSAPIVRKRLLACARMCMREGGRRSGGERKSERARERERERERGGEGRGGESERAREGKRRRGRVVGEGG